MLLKKQNAMPRSFEHFDELPNAAHVRVKTLALLMDCSVPTVWRKVKNGSIPAPVKLSPRVTAFNVGKLREELFKNGE